MNYADLCDLDLTPIEERRKHKKHEKRFLTRAARYNILLEKRGLTSDAESSSKESCYSSDHYNEVATENCDESSEISGSEFEEFHESIGNESDSADDDPLYPLKKKIKTTDNGLDQSCKTEDQSCEASYDTDSTVERAEECL